MENTAIKKDFGVVKINSLENVYTQIEKYMNENGYNVEKCDVCSIIEKDVINKKIVLFKFVHHSIPTMLTEPYYKIEFVYE